MWLIFSRSKDEQEHLNSNLPYLIDQLSIYTWEIYEINVLRVKSHLLFDGVSLIVLFESDNVILYVA